MHKDLDVRLAQLYDYTKFHIGVYLTLGSAISGLISWIVSASKEVDWYVLPLLLMSLLLMALAGLGGAMIASQVIKFTDYELYEKTQFRAAPLLNFIPDTWRRIEHYAFWAAIMLAGPVISIGLVFSPAR